MQLRRLGVKLVSTLFRYSRIPTTLGFRIHRQFKKKLFLTPQTEEEYIKTQAGKIE